MIYVTMYYTSKCNSMTGTFITCSKCPQSRSMTLILFCDVLMGWRTALRSPWDLVCNDYWSYTVSVNLDFFTKIWITWMLKELWICGKSKRFKNILWKNDMAEMYVSMHQDFWIGAHILIENCSIVILF